MGFYSHWQGVYEALASPRKPKDYQGLSTDFSTNDYLGIGKDKVLQKIFFDQYNDQYSFSSGSARLITGNHPVFQAYEGRLQALYGKSALCFNSGFDANQSIQYLYDKKDVIFADRHLHASLYQAILHSGAHLIRYRHLDMAHLQEQLQMHRANYRHALIITEGIFSMHGTRPFLPDFLALKKKFDTQLYVDEAHSFGILGQQGLGLSYAYRDEVDFVMLGLGKAAASQGGVLLCAPIVRNMLMHTAKHWIYTTAQPSWQVGWNLFVLEWILSADQQRQKLTENSLFFRNILYQKGWTKGDEEGPIFLLPALALRGGNAAIFPLYPPTVPQPSIRLSVTADLSKERMLDLAEYL